MSTEQIRTAVFATSPQMNAMSIFMAVVLGSSLIEFNELLFPPELSSIAFWGIVPCYWVALTGWFGIMAWGRYIPYLDKPTSRVWVAFIMGLWTSVLALMFFASGLPESMLSYLWGVVVMNIFYWLIAAYRYRDTGLSEPIGLSVLFSVLALVVATTYSIWSLAFPPIHSAVNWIFMSAALVIMIGYRVTLRWRHVWRPEEKQ